MRRLLKVAGVLAGLAALLAVAAVFTARPGDTSLYPAPPGDPGITVYVLANGLHSNLAIETAELTAAPGPTAEAIRRLKPQPWTYLGWGDETFYQGTGWSAARAADLTRAFFKPGNPSVLHLAGTATPTSDPTHPRVLKLRIGHAGFSRLKRELDRAFALKDGRVQPIGPGHAADSLFFKGREHFSILRVCNQWTAARLNDAGVSVAPMIDAPTSGLVWDLTHKGRAQPIAPGTP